MKKISTVVLVLLMATILSGCNQANRNEVEKLQFTKLQSNGQAPQGIRILSSNTRVRYEEYASITILGKPLETYTITSDYKWGGNNVKAFEKRRAGNDGVVTWLWRIGSNTSPGNYPIVITGGGQRLDTSYTVVP